MGDSPFSLRKDGEYSVSVEPDMTISGEVGGEGVTEVLYKWTHWTDCMHIHTPHRASTDTNTSTHRKEYAHCVSGDG